MRAAQERALAAGLTGIHDFDGLPAFRAFQLLREQGRLRRARAQGDSSRSTRGGGCPRPALGLRRRDAARRAREAVRRRGARAADRVDARAVRGVGGHRHPDAHPGAAAGRHRPGPGAGPRVRGARDRRCGGPGRARRVRGGAGQRGRRGGRRGERGASARPRLPDRIEHVQLIAPSDLPRLARLGVVASMQPIHATSDMDIADRHWGARAATAYAWRSVLSSGAGLAFGSDCPVETLSPLAGIHAAVTRRRADGSPGPDGWRPAQRLTVEQAVRAYTLGAARAAGRERDAGHHRDRGSSPTSRCSTPTPSRSTPHEIRASPCGRRSSAGGSAGEGDG